jgi:hypothetical protein
MALAERLSGEKCGGKMKERFFRFREEVFVSLGEGIEVAVQGDSATWSRGTFRHSTHKAKIPRCAVDRFWAEVERTGAGSWHGGHWSPEILVLDGEGWELEMRHGKRKCEARGSNAGPTGLAKLRRAMEQLIGAAVLSTDAYDADEDEPAES